MRWIERTSILLMHGMFMVLMIMSILLFKERLFADASYYLFHAINSEWFHIEHGRTVLGISQLLPILGTWLHLPLKVVVVLGSLGHELFYYAIFLLCLYPLKDRYGAIAVLVIHLIGQLWLYYSPMLEICYGAALIVAFYSILRSGKYKDGKWFILLLLIQWFGMMSHPENFLLIGVAIAYDILNRGFQKSIHTKVSGFAILGFLIEIFTFSSYEKGHVEIGDTGDSKGFLNLFDEAYLEQVLAIFTEYYPDLILLFLLALVVLVFQKRVWQLLLLIGSVLALVLVVNHVAEANEFGRYNESMYNPLVFLVVLFFCYELANIKKKWIVQFAFFLLLGIVSFRISWIYDFGKPLRDRSAQLERVIDYTQELGDSKYVIDTRNIEFTTWANPIEGLLYSAMDGKEESLSLVTSEDFYFKQNNKNLGITNFLFRMFEIEEQEFLNSQYFQLDPGLYKSINSKVEEKPIEWFKDKVSITALGELEALNDSTNRLWVEIQNNAEYKLPSSVEEQIYLSYHWKGEQGEVIEWDGLRTPIEVDVFSKHRQYIRIKQPDTVGTFSIVPDIVVEGKLWFELNKEYQIKLKD